MNIKAENTPVRGGAPIPESFMNNNMSPFNTHSHTNGYSNYGKNGVFFLYNISCLVSEGEGEE